MAERREVSPRPRHRRLPMVYDSHDDVSDRRRVRFHDSHKGHRTSQICIAAKHSASTPVNLQVGVAYTRGEDLVSYRKLT